MRSARPSEREHSETSKMFSENPKPCVCGAETSVRVTRVTEKETEHSLEKRNRLRRRKKNSRHLENHSSVSYLSLHSFFSRSRSTICQHPPFPTFPFQWWKTRSQRSHHSTLRSLTRHFRPSSLSPTPMLKHWDITLACSFGPARTLDCSRIGLKRRGLLIK